MLNLRIFSDYYNIGLRGRLFIGSKADLIESIVAKDIDRFIIGLMIILIGLFDLFIAMDNLKSRENIPFFGFYALCVGLYTFNITNIKDLLFYAPIFWFNVYITSLALMPVGILGFVWQTFQPSHGSVLHRLWQAHIGYAMLCLGSYLLGLYAWIPCSVGYAFIYVLRLFLILETPLILWIVLRKALQRDLDARIFIFGLVAIAFTGLHDLLVAFGRIDSSRSFIQWGILVLILSLGLVRRRTYREMRNRLEVYSRELKAKAEEKEKLMKDLHDGIGGLTTNINFLAEMAQNFPSIADMKKTFSTISELSRESLTEIRSFMRSLEEKDNNWPSLIAELRSHGANMIQSHGLSYDLKMSVQEGTEQPNSLICLNLFRIYKEALTNVVKHSGAKAVNVMIAVNPEKLLLTIRDDGIGLEKTSDRGKGLSNMKARAEAIGGSLTVSSDRGTSILLDLPLPHKYPDGGI